MRRQKVGYGDAPNTFSSDPPSNTSLVPFSPQVCEWVDPYHANGPDGTLSITTSFALSFDGLLKYEYRRIKSSPKSRRGARPQSGFIWRGFTETTTVLVVAKQEGESSPSEFRVLQDEMIVKTVPKFYGPANRCPATTVVKSGSSCESTTEEIVEVEEPLDPSDLTIVGPPPTLLEKRIEGEEESMAPLLVSERDSDSQTSHVEMMEMRASDLGEEEDAVLYVRLSGSLMPWLPTTPPLQKAGPRKNPRRRQPPKSKKRR